MGEEDRSVARPFSLLSPKLLPFLLRALKHTVVIKRASRPGRLSRQGVCVYVCVCVCKCGTRAIQGGLLARQLQEKIIPSSLVEREIRIRGGGNMGMHIHSLSARCSFRVRRKSGKVGSGWIPGGRGKGPRIGERGKCDQSHARSPPLSLYSSPKTKISSRHQSGQCSPLFLFMEGEETDIYKDLVMCVGL